MSLDYSMVGLGVSLKNHDCNWIPKYDSLLLISAYGIAPSSSVGKATREAAKVFVLGCAKDCVKSF